MAVTYSYKINRLEKAPALDGLSDVITIVRFTYTGVDENGVSGSFIGACPISPPDSGNFTPLEQLTESQVIDWVIEHHPTSNMKEMIQKQIDRQITPIRVDIPLPWDPDSFIPHAPK